MILSIAVGGRGRRVCTHHLQGVAASACCEGEGAHLGPGDASCGAGGRAHEERSELACHGGRVGNEVNGRLPMCFRRCRVRFR